MSNQEKLKNYLLGKDDKDGYLKREISNGKVIMLSGKWGSGKTHFWQKIIANDEFKKELKEKSQVYSYISLYGKSSIEEIENDIFSQSYYSAIGGENLVTKGFSTFTKRMSRFGSKKVASGLKEEQKDNIERTALKRLENGGVICFDDFERKSKDIDLNDLFGFITQLTLNFKCKVVIILNDDVFEGDEKNIFSNVKEKTISKYLKYEPSIEELFKSIFDNKYKLLEKHKELILKTLEKVEVLNARTYIQVLDNLLEFGLNATEEKTINYFVLANINFIINHTIIDGDSLENRVFFPKGLDLFHEDSNLELFVYDTITDTQRYKMNFINLLNETINKNKNITNQEQVLYKNIIKDNQALFNSIYFFHNFMEELIFLLEKNELDRINNFIETGILED